MTHEHPESSVPPIARTYINTPCYVINQPKGAGNFNLRVLYSHGTTRVFDLPVLIPLHWMFWQFISSPSVSAFSVPLVYSRTLIIGIVD